VLAVAALLAIVSMFRTLSAPRVVNTVLVTARALDVSVEKIFFLREG
jgi:hypothetical protein